MREIIFVGWVNLILGLGFVALSLPRKRAWKSYLIGGCVMVFLGAMIVWVVDWPVGLN